MPMRFCQCRGCTACGGTGQEAHSALYDLDATSTLRCPGCQAVVTTKRQARASSSSRGLGWDFSKRKAADHAYQAATHCQCRGCPRCGTRCGEAFTKANPKTAGHTVPRSQGGGSSRILAICRACNSSDGGRLASR